MRLGRNGAGGSARARSRLAATLAAAVVASVVSATPALAATMLLSDGFESGTLAFWQASSHATVQSSVVASGSWAAELSSIGQSAFLRDRLAQARTDIAMSADILLRSYSGSPTIFRLQTATGVPLLSVRVDEAGHLLAHNHVTGLTSTSPVVPGGAWHRLRLWAQVAGPDSRFEVSMDGLVIGELAKTEQLGTAGVGRVQIGESSKLNLNLVVDGVVVESPSGVADVTKPTKPTGLAAIAVTPWRVDLSWKASTDDTGVQVYVVYRNGAPLVTVSDKPTTLRDVWARPSTSYTYTVRAVDGSGNLSKAALAASATTPAGPAPGTVLAWDDFDRPDAPTLGTAPSGHAWVPDAGSTWAVENQLARLVTGQDPGRSVAAVDTGVAGDITIEADITLSPTPQRANAGLVFRYASPDSHLWAKLEVSSGHPRGLITIGKMDQNGTTSLLSPLNAVGLVNGETYHAEVVLSGLTVTFTVSGGNLPSARSITYTLTPSEQATYLGNEGAGLRLRLVLDEDDGGSRWNDFLVTAN